MEPKTITAVHYTVYNRKGEKIHSTILRASDPRQRAAFDECISRYESQLQQVANTGKPVAIDHIGIIISGVEYKP